MSDRVLVSIDGGVADVRLNRPDKLNALDRRHVRRRRRGRRGAQGRPVGAGGRALGRGPGASAPGSTSRRSRPWRATSTAGADGDRREAPAEHRRAPTAAITHLGQQACWVWRELAVPVIAAITGPCLGGGLQIALGADLRIVAPDAKLSVLEVRWGLIPDMTGTWVLPRLVGPDVAKELTWTGRMVSGEEAVAHRPRHPRRRRPPRRGPGAGRASWPRKSPVAVRHGKRLLDLVDRRRAAPPPSSSSTSARRWAR